MQRLLITCNYLPYRESLTIASLIHVRVKGNLLLTPFRSSVSLQVVLQGGHW